jgi:hypothetical protein
LKKIAVLAVLLFGLLLTSTIGVSTADDEYDDDDDEATLTISDTVGGTTDPAPGSYDYDDETVVRVTAIPYSGYEFHHWEFDGVTRFENPIDVLIDEDDEEDDDEDDEGHHTLHAVFVTAWEPD